jgi:hypothetical protein
MTYIEPVTPPSVMSDWPLRRLFLELLHVFEFAMLQDTPTEMIRDHAVCCNSLIKPVSNGLFVLKPTQLHNEALFAGKGTYCQSGTGAED